MQKTDWKMRKKIIQEITILTVQVMDWCSTCPDGSIVIIPEAKLTDWQSILIMLISQAKKQHTSVWTDLYYYMAFQIIWISTSLPISVAAAITSNTTLQN